MAKRIIIEGALVKVETVEELRALDLPIAGMVAAFNGCIIGTDIAEVKKFSDKNAAAKRLFAVLPEFEAEPVKPVETEKVAPKTATRTDSVKSILRILFATEGAAYSGKELEERTGATYKVLHDDLARLKNPKYAGKNGVLNIVKNGDVYTVAEDIETEVEVPSTSPAGEAC
jgi:hypothetical protein